MPIYDLIGPGGEVYDLTVPDGATAQDIANAGRQASRALTALAQPGGFAAVDPSGRQPVQPSPPPAEPEPATPASPTFDTKLTPADEQRFQAWKQQFAPHDSGQDYDLRGAFKAGLTPGPNGHFSDRFKKPNHPTFSDQSQYARFAPEKAGRWEGERYIPPVQSTTTAVTTSGLAPGTPIPSPAGYYAGVGSTIGGALGGMGGAAVAAPVPGLSFVAAPGGALAGAEIGELIQAGVEHLLGMPPSRAGALTQRADMAGTEGLAAEVLVQTLGLPLQVVPFLQSLTPTARISTAQRMADKMRALAELDAQGGVQAAERTAQGNVVRAGTEGLAAGGAQRTAEETSRAGGMQAIREAAPDVRGQAARAINQTTGTAQRQAAAAEGELPRRVVLRSDRLAGPEPRPVTLQTYEPRTLGGQPGQTVPWTRPPRVELAEPLEPLRVGEIPQRALDPRRELERVGGVAQDTATLLAPIRDAVGDVETARRLAANPDAATLLLQHAQTDDERRVIQWLIDGAKAAGREATTVPSEVQAAAVRAAEKQGATAVGKAERRGAAGIRRAEAKGDAGVRAAQESTGSAHLGSKFLLGTIGFGAHGPLGAAAGIALESVIRKVADRMLNSPMTPVVARGVRDVLVRPGANISFLGQVPEEFMIPGLGTISGGPTPPGLPGAARSRTVAPPPPFPPARQR